MRTIKEIRKLVKVKVLYDGARGYTFGYQGGQKIFHGSVEGLAAFLRKIKASDNATEPRSERNMTYMNMAREIQTGSDPYIWVWSGVLANLQGSVFSERVEDGRVQIMEQVDANKVIKDLAKAYGDSNEDQGKMVQLLRGLAFSDQPEANEFMKALDKWTTEYSQKMQDGRIDEAVNQRAFDTLLLKFIELLEKYRVGVLNSQSLDNQFVEIEIKNPIKLSHVFDQILADFYKRNPGARDIDVSWDQDGDESLVYFGSR